MLIIDRDMPLNCRECPSRQRSEKNMGENYCMEMSGKLIKSDIFTKRADFCPIKCDIEDIKAEIEEGLNACIDIIENVKKGVYPKLYSEDEMDGRKITYEHCLKIINNHTKESSDAGSN